MSKYRITYDNLRENGLSFIEVEAASVDHAIFRAAVQAVHDTDAEPDELKLVRIEQPAGWVEVGPR